MINSLEIIAFVFILQIDTICAMVDFENFLSLILQTVLPVAAAMIAGAAVALAKHFLAKLQFELGTSRYNLLSSIVRTGVLYAEQAGITGAIENAGEEKKREAINFVVRQLDNYGLSNVNVDEVSRLIEASVHDVFKREKESIYALLDNEPEEVIPSPDEEK